MRITSLDLIKNFVQDKNEILNCLIKTKKMTITIRTKIENFLTSISHHYSTIITETVKNEFQYTNACPTDCIRNEDCCSSECVENTIQAFIDFVALRCRLDKETLTQMWRES